MRWDRTSAIVLRYFYLMRGSFSRVVPLFAWVAVDILLWGFISKYLNRIAATGFNFTEVFLGAVLLWDFFQRVMMGVTMTFFEDVWSRNFLNFFATPLLISEYLAGLVISSICTSTIGLIVMTAVAAAAFGLSLLPLGLAALPFVMILFLFGIALGVIASAVVLRLGPASEWFIWPIPALLSPFAGVFYPLSTLPAPMRAVGRLLPPSYVFENLRAIIGGRPPLWGDLVIGVALSAAYILLGAWVFARTYRYAVRVGLVARYSAESVS